MRLTRWKFLIHTHTHTYREAEICGMHANVQSQICEHIEAVVYCWTTTVKIEWTKCKMYVIHWLFCRHLTVWMNEWASVCVYVLSALTVQLWSKRLSLTLCMQITFNEIFFLNSCFCSTMPFRCGTKRMILCFFFVFLL